MELGEPRSVADHAAGDRTGPDEPDTSGLPPVLAKPLALDRRCSLFDRLAQVPGCPKARGNCYPLQTILAISIATRLAREQLAELGSFFSPSSGSCG